MTMSSILGSSDRKIGHSLNNFPGQLAFSLIFHVFPMTGNLVNDFPGFPERLGTLWINTMTVPSIMSAPRFLPAKRQFFLTTVTEWLLVGECWLSVNERIWSRPALHVKCHEIPYQALAFKENWCSRYLVLEYKKINKTF